MTELRIHPDHYCGTHTCRQKRPRIVDLRRPRDGREPMVFPPGELLHTETKLPTQNRCLLDPNIMEPLQWGREDLVGELRRAGAV